MIEAIQTGGFWVGLALILLLGGILNLIGISIFLLLIFYRGIRYGKNIHRV